MTPRCVAAYLEASLRNDARERLTNAMVFGYVHLDKDDQRSLLNMWALQARGEELTEENMSEASGIKVVQPENIGNWLDSLQPIPQQGK